MDDRATVAQWRTFEARAMSREDLARTVGGEITNPCAFSCYQLYMHCSRNRYDATTCEMTMVICLERCAPQ